PRPKRRGHKPPGAVDEADARDVLPAPLGVALRDLGERLLSFAVAGDVDERVRAQERLRIVRDVGPAEDDQRLRTSSLQSTCDCEAAVAVPEVGAEAGGLGFRI